jgi:intein/homing endonuclease
MTDSDRIWLAGFFDGDGNMRGAPYNEIIISQKDQVNVERIHEISGVGYISPFVGYKGNTYWRLHIKGNDIKRFYEMIRPYMRTNKAKQLDALYIGLP